MKNLFRLFALAAFIIGLIFLKDIFEYTDILPALVCVGYFLYFAGIAAIFEWLAKRAERDETQST